MKKICFITVDAILVAVVGVLVGLFCKDTIFVNNAGIAAFVCLLITLCIPSVMFLLSEKMGYGSVIDFGLFIFGELIINILFLCQPQYGEKAFAISQACLIAVFLVVLLILIASGKSQKE